ncbi:MAG: hypothetical protein ACLU4N_27230 [Butyricimonas faecihominis]
MDQFLHLLALRADPASVFMFVARAERYCVKANAKASDPAPVSPKRVSMTDSSRLQGSNQSLLYLFMSYDVFKKHLINFRF